MKHRLAVFSLLLALCAATGLFAQHDHDFASPTPKDENDENKPVRKHSWFFHRAARKTAEEQLRYADSLAEKGDKSAAMKAYNHLVYNWYLAPQAATAQYRYARLMEETGRYAKAFDEYQYLIDFHAGQFPYDDVLDRQFKIANLMMTAKKNRWFFGGYTAPERALPMFEKIVENGPTWKNAAQAQYFIGLINEQADEFELAAQAYETARYRFPKSVLAVDAAYRRANCLYGLAKDAPRDEEAQREAMSALSMFARDNPDNENAEDALKRLAELKDRLALACLDKAVYYDTIVKRPKSAIVAYEDVIRNFRTTRAAEIAGERIDELKARLEKQDEM